MADVGNRAHIRKRHWLTANQVCTCLNAHERNFFRSFFFYRFFKQLQVKIAFERVVADWLQTFFVNQFNDFAALACDVCFCGGEVEIHERDHARFYKALGKNVLGSASLVSGEHVINAEDFFDGFFKAIETF